MTRYDLNLRFLNKESVLFQSIDQNCSRNLADVKMITKNGEEIYLHRIILRFAFPQIDEMFPDDDTVTIINDSEYF